MKNQNDLIGLIVAIVVGLGGILTFYFMKPTPPTVTAPAEVKTADAKLAPGAVTFVAALPGGSSNTMGGGAAGFGGRAPGGPPSGMMSMPGGPGFAPSGVSGAGGGAPAGGKRMPGANDMAAR